jgi:hypothetical protein
VWERVVDGKSLSFHLAGINNQNFIMRDEETGSWWQQVTGEAIFGPLKGSKLTPVFHDELAFETWKREQPAGRVLRPDQNFAKGYVRADWEKQIEKFPVVTPASPGDALPPRTLVIGVTVSSAAKAYPFPEVQKAGLVQDSVGGADLALVVNSDKESARAFGRSVDGRTLDLFVKPGAAPLSIVDAQTGSEWDFSGKAVKGPLAGKQLTRVPILLDYWFDWKIYHAETQVYLATN